MRNGDIKLQTAALSLVGQFILGIVTISALTFDFKPRHRVLRQILLLESISQVVEFIYYCFVVCYYHKIITWTRYLDWVISTPLMLLTTIAFFEYRRTETFEIDDLLNEFHMYVILACNWFMLVFGFLVEINRLPNTIGLPLGMLMFIVVFYTLADVAIRSQDVMSMIIYFIMFFVWGLYGVAATVSDVKKNVSYNILDLISKNFYGVFLFSYALSVQ